MFPSELKKCKKCLKNASADLSPAVNLDRCICGEPMYATKGATIQEEHSRKFLLDPPMFNISQHETASLNRSLQRSSASSSRCSKSDSVSNHIHIGPPTIPVKAESTCASDCAEISSLDTQDLSSSRSRKSGGRSFVSRKNTGELDGSRRMDLKPALLQEPSAALSSMQQSLEVSRKLLDSGSNSYQEDWEAFPTFDLLTVFDLLDNFAIPQQLEKLGQCWNDNEAVTLREKLSFIGGVLNIFISGFIIGGYPEYFHIWYTAQLLYYMPIRFYTYHKRGWGYFLADLCYFVNFLTMLSIWVFPNSKRLFVSTYFLAYGNNAVAVAMWRNSMVFHSLNKVTTYVLPLILIKCLVLTVLQPLHPHYALCNTLLHRSLVTTQPAKNPLPCYLDYSQFSCCLTSLLLPPLNDTLVHYPLRNLAVILPLPDNRQATRENRCRPPHFLHLAPPLLFQSLDRPTRNLLPGIPA